MNLTVIFESAIVGELDLGVYVCVVVGRGWVGTQECFLGNL